MSYFLALLFPQYSTVLFVDLPLVALVALVVVAVVSLVVPVAWQKTHSKVPVMKGLMA